jgi:hypothetical protein
LQRVRIPQGAQIAVRATIAKCGEGSLKPLSS